MCLHHQEACVLTPSHKSLLKSQESYAGRAAFATDPSETERMSLLFNGPHAFTIHKELGITQGLSSVILTVLNVHAPGLKKPSTQHRASGTDLH